MKRVWTEEQFTKAKELRKKNLSFTEVGKELGMTKNAVIGKFYREGYVVKRQTVTSKGIARNNYTKYKVIGTGTCYMCNREYPIHSKFDRFCKPCKKSDMYIGSH
jgi:hypothetical protein|tara:strand:- start:21 stop:335 length:315 start_codon:yes stop_codon:yes gene_type:complete